MRPLAALLGALLTCGVGLLVATPASAYCRRSSPAWSDANPVRVVIHSELHNYLRHPFSGGSAVACTTNADCGADGLCASGFTSAPFNRCRGPRWTASELQRAVQWVISRINSHSAADIPLVYLDTSTTSTCPLADDCTDGARPWMSCFQSNTVVLIATECDNIATTWAEWTGLQWNDTNYYNRNPLIRFTSSNSIDGNPALGDAWTHYAGFGNAWHFEAVLLHEMGHVLGLGHVVNSSTFYSACVPDVASLPNSVCPSDPAPSLATSFDVCAIMNSSPGRGLGLGADFYARDDIQGLLALYGTESSPDVRIFEDDNLASSSFVEFPIAEMPMISDMAASARLGELSPSAVTIVGRMAVPSGGLSRFRWHTWNWSPPFADTFLADVTTTLTSTGPIGAAETSTARTFSHHALLLTSDARRYNRRIQDVIRVNSGGTITTTASSPAVGSLADTTVGGVSTAHDPRSGATLHAIRADSGEVLIVGQRTGTWSNPAETDILSYSQPSIACAPTTCFMVFVEMPRPVTSVTTTRLQWVEFQFDWSGSASSTANFRPLTGVVTTWNNVVNDPIASVVARPDGNFDFVVTVALPAFISSASAYGTRVFAYRHTAGSASLDLLLPQVVDLPGVAAQAVAAGVGNFEEVITFSSY